MPTVLDKGASSLFSPTDGFLCRAGRGRFRERLLHRCSRLCFITHFILFLKDFYTVLFSNPPLSKELRIPYFLDLYKAKGVTPSSSRRWEFAASSPSHLGYFYQRHVFKNSSERKSLMQEVRQFRTAELQSSLIQGNSTIRDYFMPCYLREGR